MFSLKPNAEPSRINVESVSWLPRVSPEWIAGETPDGAVVYKHNGVIYDSDSVRAAVPRTTSPLRSRGGAVLTPEEAVTQAYERGDDAAIARAILALYRAALLACPMGLRLLPLEAAKGPRSLKAEVDRRAAGWGEGALVWIHNQATTDGVAPKGTYPTHYGPCWVRDERIMAAANSTNMWGDFSRQEYHITRLAGCVARVFFGGWDAHRTVGPAVREYNNLFPTGPDGWAVALPEIQAGRPLEMLEL